MTSDSVTDHTRRAIANVDTTFENSDRPQAVGSAHLHACEPSEMLVAVVVPAVSKQTILPTAKPTAVS